MQRGQSFCDMKGSESFKGLSFRDMEESEF